MLDIIKNILKKTGTEEKKAAQEPAETELQIATCALLLEIAHADDEFSPEEEKHIEQLMQRHFDLSGETVQELKKISDTRRKESIDLWQFANTVKGNFTPKQKENLIEMIWSVIYIDNTLDQHEDYLAHKLAKLLGLDHGQLIDAKVKILRQASDDKSGR